LLVLAVVPAVWHVVDFEEDVDPEFPTVERPTFSVVPPAAYRLAEPGDTLDRVEIYASAVGVVLAAGGVVLSNRRARWPSALAISLAALWYSATPGPTTDGWYGLGWQTIADARAPLAIRGALLAAASVMGLVVAANVLLRHDSPAGGRGRFRTPVTNRLWVIALCLVVARQFEIPSVEPSGYWPRWAMIWGLVAFDLGLVIELARGLRSPVKRLLFGLLAPPSWLVLVILGINVTWYHRPLARLKAVVPDRIYISGMPTKRGLEIEQRRHAFRTIINLFPEDTPQRSPLLAEELRFVRERGIRYIASPSDPSPAAADAFLTETLRLAQDPSAWPILVHCHGCMDRSPAWMGIYRFVVQGCALKEVMQEIERHRGYRPKASVILLYNRVLPERAAARYAGDPTAELLRRCAGGLQDRMPVAAGSAREVANLDAASGVHGEGRPGTKAAGQGSRR
jgi:protein tyrosine phosphatase (PTP) superfamily phosphohydrolase (DUF442 family)